MNPKVPQILAEAAALGRSMRLTSDEHFRSIDFQQLGFELAPFGLAAPIIGTPRDIPPLSAGGETQPAVGESKPATLR